MSHPKPFRSPWEALALLAHLWQRGPQNGAGAAPAAREPAWRPARLCGTPGGPFTGLARLEGDWIHFRPAPGDDLAHSHPEAESVSIHASRVLRIVWLREPDPEDPFEAEPPCGLEFHEESLP